LIVLKGDNSRKIKVEYKNGESPLEDGSTKQVLDIFQDQKFMETVRIYHGVERGARDKRTGGRGRGRGRGRGSRGRGKDRRHYR
jgi:hypothetical protein